MSLYWLTDMTDFPNQIRTLRKTRGFTLAELGFRANVTDGHLSHLERGMRRLNHEVAQRIAHALGVTVGDLLNSVDNPDALNPSERDVIVHYRAAPPEIQAAVRAVIVPYRPEPPKR